MLFLKKKRWWPIWGGTAFALVELLSFAMSERPLGVTRGLTVFGSIITYLISPSHSEKVSYWAAYGPVIDYSFVLVAGLVIGGFISARASGEFKFKLVPEFWKSTHGPSVWHRWAWAFVAGLMMGFAARLTGGCVSGLLISAAIQLAPGGYIFMLSLWIGAVLTTAAFYGLKGYSFKR